MFVLLIALLISQFYTQIIAQNPCGVNAEYTEYCGVGCATCAQPDLNTIDPRCTLSFIARPRCSCLPGYVRNTAANNTCVPVNSFECRAQRFYSYISPPYCGRNAQFVYCNPCGASCADPCICGICVCNDGYLRDRNGNCILANSLQCRLERLIIIPVTLSPVTAIVS